MADEQDTDSGGVPASVAGMLGAVIGLLAGLALSVFASESANPTTELAEEVAAMRSQVASLKGEVAALEEVIRLCTAGDLRASGSAGSPAAPTARELTDDEKNRLWWKWERANGQVSDAVGDRFSERGGRTVAEFVAALDREFRSPIAAEFGLTYEQGKALFDEAESASWRTARPP